MLSLQRLKNNFKLWLCKVLFHGKEMIKKNRYQLEVSVLPSWFFLQKVWNPSFICEGRIREICPTKSIWEVILGTHFEIHQTWMTILFVLNPAHLVLNPQNYIQLNHSFGKTPRLFDYFPYFDDMKILRIWIVEYVVIEGELGSW